MYFACAEISASLAASSAFFFRVASAFRLSLISASAFIASSHFFCCCSLASRFMIVVCMLLVSVLFRELFLSSDSEPNTCARVHV